MSVMSNSSSSQASKSSASQSSQSIKTQASQSSLSNPFSTLQLDDDDEDDDDDDDDDDDNESDNNTNNDDDNLTFNSDLIAHDENDISIQSRYLTVKIKSFICDSIRKEAIDLERTNEASVYIKIAALWQLAYLRLNEVIISTDEWWAILIDNKVVLRDKHNKRDLEELNEGLQILRDDTIAEKDRTMHRLNIIFQRINEKLNPMLTERNDVKKKFGLWKWTHNEQPKLDYAEKRAKLEQDHKDLTHCINVLANLEAQEI
jgi:hypothetical protein